MFMILPGCLFFFTGWKVASLRSDSFLLNILCIFVGILVLTLGLILIIGGIKCQNC